MRFRNWNLRLRLAHEGWFEAVDCYRSLLALNVDVEGFRSSFQHLVWAGVGRLERPLRWTLLEEDVAAGV